MGMVFVVNAAGVGEDLGLDLFPYLGGWDEVNAKVGEFGQFRQ